MGARETFTTRHAGWIIAVALLVGCDTAAPDPLSAPTWDDDLDPSLLEDLYGAADSAAACSDHPGGELSGDDLLVVVNKEEARQLADDWAPQDLTPIHDDFMMPGREGLARLAAVQAFYELAQAAFDEAGLELRVRSAYRSFVTQCYTFNYKVETSGYEHAARFSARPGRSEHQLGTALDITSSGLDYALTQAMGDTEEGRWLAQNAYRFGFGLSYPEGQEALTGYGYEPWHWRYVGREAALELHSSEHILLDYLLRCDADDGQSDGLICPQEAPPEVFPNQGFIGGLCGADEECSSIGEGAQCLIDELIPEGLCTMPCERYCPDRPGLNAATFCVGETAEATEGLCQSRCDFDLFRESGCRDGFSCQTASRPNDAGTAPVCLPLAPQEP